jgi:Ca-activated chloride channel family protein
MTFPAFPIRLDYLAVWQAIIVYLFLALPILWLGARSMAGLDPFRKWASVGLRLDLLMLLILILSGARWVEPIKDLTVVMVRDVSRSIENVNSADGSGIQADISRYVEDRLRAKPPADRVGVIAFDGLPWVDAIPDVTLRNNGSAIRKPTDGTDIGQAIQLALATMPQDTMHRIVLFSDGNATTGDLDQAVRAATSEHIPIDVMPLRYEIDHEISIDKLVAPSSTKQNAPFTLDVEMRSQNPGPVSATLSITDNGVPLIMDRIGSDSKIARDVLLKPGPNVEHLLLPPQPSGAHDFRATLEPVGPGTIDTIAQNNSAEAMTLVLGKSKVLYVEGPQLDSSEPLRQALISEGIIIEESAPGSVPRTLPQLQQYDAVILVNVPKTLNGLDELQAAALDTYVSDMGGGLIVIGGPDSFGAGGWIGSKLERLLPVDCQPPTRQVMPAGALIIVIDHSGSMGETLGDSGQTKEQAANESAILALKALSSEDQVGVIAFDTDPVWVVPLGLNHHAETTAAAIREISPAGGTEIYPALEAADDAMSRLSPQETPVRHILLLTDGQSMGGDFDRLISQMAARGVTLSTVGVGNDIDEALLTRFARLGRGRFYRVSNSKTLPQIFIKEAMTLRNTLIREEPFTPRLRPGISPLVTGIDSLPRLTGMVRTWPKPAPTVEVPIVADNGEPILADWHVGLGQVVAFTSDAERRWAADWVASPMFGKFWTQIVRGAVRPTVSNAAEARIIPTTSGQLKIIVEAAGPDGSFQDFLNMSAKVFGPDPEQPSRTVHLVQTGPGTYEGQFDAPDAGAYLTMVSFAGQNTSSGWTAATYEVDGSAEWHDLKSNEAALQDIAMRTGGRVIEPFDQNVDLFDRNDLYPQSASSPLTDLLLMWAMCTLLLDVAIRRIAWDRHSIARMANAFANFIRSYTQVRIPEAQLAVGALRTVRQSIGSKSESKHEWPAHPVGSTTEKSSIPQTPGFPIGPARPPQTSQSKQPEVQVGDGNSSPFERLAAAKRRARENRNTEK